jgi:hypothetical protein
MPTAEITPPAITSTAMRSIPTRKPSSEASVRAAWSCARCGPTLAGACADSAWALLERTAAGTPASFANALVSVSSEEANCDATTAPTSAMATSPATRAMALLTPEARLACSSSTPPSTVAVRGATVMVRPSPKISAPGSTSVR